MSLSIRDWIWKNRRWYPRRGSPPVPIGELLGRLREGPLWEEGGIRWRIEEVVAETLGPALFGHVLVGNVRSGRLLLCVDDPAYEFMLRNYWYTRLLGELQRDVPQAKIYELRFRLDPKAGAGAGGGELREAWDGHAERVSSGDEFSF